VYVFVRKIMISAGRPEKFVDTCRKTIIDYLIKIILKIFGKRERK